jgi:hypothetical protein
VADIVAGRVQNPTTLFAAAGISGMLCLVLGDLLGRAR